MNNNNFHYNKKLKTLARKLRKNPTRAENRLWYELLINKQFGGLRFLRQRIIDKYITDFFCKELKLIIEVDGITHDCQKALARDTKRDARLKELGYTTVRFSNWEVLNDLGLVQELLIEKVLKINSSQFYNYKEGLVKLSPSGYRKN